MRAGKRDALIDHRGVKLHRRGAGADLCIGLLGGADTAHADQRQAAVGQLRQLRQHAGGLFEQRRAGKPARLVRAAALCRPSRDSVVLVAMMPARRGGQRHFDDLAPTRSSVRSGAIFRNTGIGRGKGRPRLHHARAAGPASAARPCRVAQFLGVGGGDVDGGEIDVRAAERPARGRNRRRGRRCPCWRRGSGRPARVRGRAARRAQDRLHPLVVEAEAVDRGAVLGQPEQARAGVAVLRAGGGGPDLEKAEARAGRGGRARRRSCHSLRQGPPGSRASSPPAS